MESLDAEAIAAGLSAAEVQSTARRQFVASIAVAIVIALGVALSALIPTPRNRAEAAAHKIVLVQQPVFTSGAKRVAAEKQDRIELP